MESPQLTATRAQYLLIKRVQELPFSGLFEAFHESFRYIKKEGFLRAAADKSLFAFQLAALIKYVLVYGEYQKKRPRYDMASYLNAVKNLWRVTERERTYSEDPDTIAIFLLRFSYANLPFVQHQDSIASDLRRAIALFVIHASKHGSETFDFNREFWAEHHLTPEHFIQLGWEFYQAFCQRVDWTEGKLKSFVPAELRPFVPQALKVLAASRQKFRSSYHKVRAKDANQAFYKPNPLLWIPIIAGEGQYYAPYPELVAYASTRGLFFTCGKRWKNFSEEFGHWFEAYVGSILRTHIRSGQVIAADEEKKRGYDGKNCDWTVLLGDAGLLVECKSSALFSTGKRLATPDAVKSDLAKNLAGEGKGLFQLYEKLQAIKGGKLPSPFKERYSKIITWYPVVILYDQIQHANARKVLRNLLDSALHKAGISNFSYQIWHVEELENLLDLVPEADLVLQVLRKWENSRMFEWDLNTYLYSLFKHDRLRSDLIIPEKDSIAYEILKELSD